MSDGTENIFDLFFENNPDIICITGSDNRIVKVNPEWERRVGYTLTEVAGTSLTDYVHHDDLEKIKKTLLSLAESKETQTLTFRIRYKTGVYKSFEWHWFASGSFLYASARDIVKEKTVADKKALSSMSDRVTAKAVKEQNIIHEALQKKVLALTKPIDDPEGIQLTDLFDIDELQTLQDNFADAVRVASIITFPDGTPITRPSKFTRLCNLIRATEKGCINCYKSDSALGRMSEKGPIISTCLSIGLWDGGASITLGGKHIANWLIGQVRNEAVDDEKMLEYADEIGLDRKIFREALREVPVMSQQHFIQACQFLKNLADELSVKAYQNIQQARFICGQKQAEEALQKSESILKATMEGMADGILVVTKNGKVTHFNSSFVKIFNIPEKILLTGDDSKLLNIAKKQLSDPEEFIKKTYKINNTDDVSVDILHFSDGRVIERHSFPLTELNDLNGRVWIFRNITERKRAEEIIIKNQQLLNDSQRLAHIGCWEFYFKENRLFLNEEALKIYGYNKSESYITYDTFQWHLHPDDKKMLANRLEELLSGRDFKDFECRIIRSDGGIRTVIVVGAVSRDDNGKAYKLFGIIQDITERKEAELALKENESILKATMEAMSDGILVTATGGVITDYNNRFLEIFNMPEELLLKREIRMVHEYVRNLLKDSELYFKKDNEILETKISSEDILHFNNGKIIERLSFPLIEEGMTKGRVWVFRDITERKKAEVEIKQLNSQLEKRVYERTIQLRQVNRDLESFAYSVSHDLRAPIRHIDGFVKLMYSRMSEHTEVVTNYYNKIEAASQRMSSMIESLLSFSRLGRKELSLSVTDMQTLIAEIIEEVSPDIEQRTIKWDISTLPEIKCDRSLMKLAFENLISNAIKYTSKKEKAEITIGWNPVNDYKIEIYVKDNGAGFDMSFSGKLFGVFQRLHPPEEFEGIGIGLANVRQIVEKHNGNVRAEGKINEGAVFYITLPK